MQFLFPVFLLAGLALLIPVFIHLFNLRRYKTIQFPHTKFLRDIQLRSRKQNEVKYKWLLAMRLLFLASLILAFAQPFFSGKKVMETGGHLKVIYIDNSPSMSLKKGARTLLDLAKEAAVRQIQQDPAGDYFLVTADGPVAYTALPAAQVEVLIRKVNISDVNHSGDPIFSTIQDLVKSEGGTRGASVYYYSDLQKNTFNAHPDKALLADLNIHFVPVQASEGANLYIDTAWLTTPVLQTGQSNALIVRTRRIGKATVDNPIVQLSIDGQVKSASSISFRDSSGMQTDTLAFTPDRSGWQRITVAVNDATIRFDDSFYIAARSAPSLAVLVLNEGNVNPYINAAFHSNPGFQTEQNSVGEGQGKDWKSYNLIVLNGVTSISETLGEKLAVALQAGQSVVIFPGRISNFSNLNTGLAKMGDIRINGLDTASQSATTLQQGSDLAKDIFEHVPDNVDLPLAKWHYVLQAGLNANQQNVLSFRNGDPMLAAYNMGRGRLYFSSVSADPEAGNFPGSYFFVPFLYQMAVQSRGGDVYALTAGHNRAMIVPLSNAGERNMLHAKNGSVDVIPSQRPGNGGLEVYLDNAVKSSGFYQITGNAGDSVVAGWNLDRSESQLQAWDIDALKKEWTYKNTDWLNVNDVVNGKAQNEGPMPLWKVCAILALVWLAAETILLLRSGTVPATAV